MYTWEDIDGKSITLRPEYTAPVVRSFIQHNLGANSATQRFYYLGSLFRRERPQKGRQRQFNQFGIEAFGSHHPEQDVEVISVGWKILEELGLNKGLSLKINSLGSKDCRELYRDSLKKFIRPNLEHFSITSQNRFKTNPLRILDSKSESDKNLLKHGPQVSDYYSKEDQIHFDEIQKYLKELKIPFLIDNHLVRGLDYYTRTTFEITSDALGAQDAILGGGRYDHLVENLGGKPTPAVGFAAGIERVLLSIESQGINNNKKNIDVYFACIDSLGLSVSLSLSNKLRDLGISVLMDTLRRSIKAQLREANKSGAKYAIIVGEAEIKNNEVIVKDLQNGTQMKVPQSKLINKLSGLI